MSRFLTLLALILTACASHSDVEILGRVDERPNRPGGNQLPVRVFLLGQSPQEGLMTRLEFERASVDDLLERTDGEPPIWIPRDDQRLFRGRVEEHICWIGIVAGYGRFPGQVTKLLICLDPPGDVEVVLPFKRETLGAAEGASRDRVIWRF